MLSVRGLITVHSTDAGEDAAAVDAEPAGGEVVFGMLEGADGRDLNGLWRQPGSDELQAVALGEVDVPLGSEE